MKIKKLLLFIILIASAPLFVFNIIKSANTMVGFSEPKFILDSNEYKTLFFSTYGGVEKTFYFKIKNLENQNASYRLGFVDSSISNDIFGNNVCLSENENTVFGQYLSGDQSDFTITGNSEITKEISLTLPNYYSGTYNGCIVYYPSNTGTLSTVNTLPSRGSFISVNVSPTGVPFTIKAFPSNRVNQTTNNSNSGTVKIYDTNNNLIRTLDFSSNNLGTGIVLINVFPGTYHIAFKGQSQLASYISGFIITGQNQIIDFTTGTNLFGTQNLNNQQDDGNQYQTAGDLQNINGVYDFMINGNDIAILTANGLQENGVSATDPRNLNGDSAVNASDISVIGVNFEKTDIYFNNIFNR